jgi:uncharacterized protein (DUF362 family)
MSDERLTRRECLTRGAGAVVAAAAAATGGYLLCDSKGAVSPREPKDAALRVRRPGLKNFFASVDFPASNPRISIAIGGALEQESSPTRESISAPVEKLVRAAIAGLDPSLGIKRFITRGDVVLIKPNVGFDRPPHLGATTNPEVLRWVIRLCREAGAVKIIVTDNPIESPEACFAKSGIARVADAEGAQLVQPTQSRFETVSVGNGSASPARGLPDRWPILHQPLVEATKLIGVAPVKDHNLCSASMNLKNWYGLLGGRRNQFHQAIHEVISDLALLFSPTLVIADATRVMMRNGPTGGRTSDVKPGGELGRPALIASVDPVACDAWCYQNLLGRDPARLTYLDLAQRKIGAQIGAGERRLGELNWRAYERLGQIATVRL